MAGVSGAVGQDFPVDFAIDPESIPRHSFIDIRDGRFDPRSIAGKDVVIGATAVELGDRYAVPNHGVIAGVVIQAMAAETLSNGIPHEAGWPVPVILALIPAAAVLAARSRLQLAAASAWGLVALFGASVFANAVLHWHFPIVPAAATLGVAIAIALAVRILRSVHRRRTHDVQSGLPNRTALRDALRTRPGASVVTARFSAFDKLATSLDEAGIAELVRRVRDRIAIVAEGDTVYRVEDRVLAWRCYDPTDLETRLGTLRTLMLTPIEIGGRRVDVMLACGIAAERGTEPPERIISRAGLAADLALAQGESWHFHDTLDDDEMDREISLLGELDEAILKREIHLVYQPKLDLVTNRIASVEALVRWDHPTRGFLRPDLFIPLAERNDRIASLTLHVLEQTIADLMAWQDSGNRIAGAVNLSAKLLSSHYFIEALRELVKASGIAPDMLIFEVTESAAMSDPVIAANALQSFRDLGIAISMDDYGTGQSTLSYLKQLPLNELKIDRSFVQFAHQNRSDGALVRSTVNLAHELGLKVVAEGVEDAECLAFLCSIGCDYAQGYLISRPVRASDLENLLKRKLEKAA